jgi:hypothetical protein
VGLVSVVWISTTPNLRTTDLSVAVMVSSSTPLIMTLFDGQMMVCSVRLRRLYPPSSKTIVCLPVAWL